MWTKENRRRYDCSDLRYKSDLTDDERAEIVSLIPPAKPGRKKRSVNPREVVNGLMYILSTGCQCARSQRIWRRTRRSRRRGVAAGHSVRPMSVLAQALRGRRLSGARVPQVHPSRALSGAGRDRQAFRSGQGLRRAAQTLRGGENPRLAQPLPPLRQGLGEPQSQGASFSADGIHLPHGQEAMPCLAMFLDRLLARSISPTRATTNRNLNSRSKSILPFVIRRTPRSDRQ
jgi:transposase